MKVSATLDVNVTMGGGVSPKFTSLQGYLPRGTDYRDIVRVFGKSQSGESPDGKIKAEWVGKINGIVFTIYDYNSVVKPKDNTNWHIGGKVDMVADLVTAYLRAFR